MKILSIGDNAADCYKDKNLFFPGGSSVNTIISCKRNGIDECGYLGVFGNDIAAAHIEYALEKEGIDTKRCRKLYAKSAYPQILLKEDGTFSFLCSPRQTSQHLVKIKLVEEDMAYIRNFDIIHCGFFSNMEEELINLRPLGKISFDFAFMTDFNYIEKVCPHIDYAFFSASHLSKEEQSVLIEKCHGLGAEIVGLTLGKEGSLFSKEGKLYFQSIKPSKAIDTMGAGDGFIGCFLSIYPETGDMEIALEKASEYAAKVCENHGAFGYPKEIYKGLLD